jgi:hypothetical protein
MNITKLLTLFFMLSLASQYSHAADRLRVLDRGLDGNQRTYLVTCPDGTLTSVIQTFDIPVSAEPYTGPTSPDVFAGGGRAIKPHVTRVCAQARDGQDICRTSWDLDEAARASCN